MLKRGENYEDTAWNVVMFICKEDPFGLDRKVSRYETKIKDTDYVIYDRTEVIIIYPKGTKGEVTLEQQEFLDYLNKKEIKGVLAEKIEGYIKEAKSDAAWKEQFMTLEQYYNEAREEGREEGYDEAKLVYLKDFVADVDRLADSFHLTSEEICRSMKRSYQDYLDAKAFIEGVENK